MQKDKKRKKENDVKEEMCNHDKILESKPKLNLECAIDQYIQLINKPREIVNKDEFLLNFRH